MVPCQPMSDEDSSVMPNMDVDTRNQIQAGSVGPLCSLT